jgi:hypothetical protein
LVKLIPIGKIKHILTIFQMFLDIFILDGKLSQYYKFEHDDGRFLGDCADFVEHSEEETHPVYLADDVTLGFD